MVEVKTGKNFGGVRAYTSGFSRHALCVGEPARAADELLAFRGAGAARARACAHALPEEHGIRQLRGAAAGPGRGLLPALRARARHAVQGPPVLPGPGLCGHFHVLPAVDNLATSGTYPVSVSIILQEALHRAYGEQHPERAGGRLALIHRVCHLVQPGRHLPGRRRAGGGDIPEHGRKLGDSRRAPARIRAASRSSGPGRRRTSGRSGPGERLGHFQHRGAEEPACGKLPAHGAARLHGRGQGNGTASFAFTVPGKAKAEFAAAAADPMLPGEKREVR